MKRIPTSLIAAIAAVALITPARAAKLQSVGPITFDDKGVLYVSDPKAAAIHAYEVDSAKTVKAGKAVKVANIGSKIAALVGANAEDILIVDLAVNPVSKNAYLAVSRGRGTDATPALIRVAGGKLSVVSTKKSKATAKLPNAPVDKTVRGRRGPYNARLESITDIAYVDGRIIVAGLSNEEFASTLRSIKVPFGKVDRGSSVEIFHGAHGRFETRSPVRTFVPFKVGDTPSVLAAYTCTPLVQFPIADIKPMGKVKGKTIAELGNRNRPLDMIVYQQGGKDYVLIANSARGIMKVDTGNMAAIDSITKKISGTAGVTYKTIERWKGIDQLDKYSSKLALVVRSDDSGSTLETIPLP
jgi:hypothetical protein